MNQPVFKFENDIEDELDTVSLGNSELSTDSLDSFGEKTEQLRKESTEMEISEDNLDEQQRYLDRQIKQKKLRIMHLRSAMWDIRVFGFLRFWRFCFDMIYPLMVI